MKKTKQTNHIWWKKNEKWNKQTTFVEKKWKKQATSCHYQVIIKFIIKKILYINEKNEPQLIITKLISFVDIIFISYENLYVYYKIINIIINI